MKTKKFTTKQSIGRLERVMTQLYMKIEMLDKVIAKAQDDIKDLQRKNTNLKLKLDEKKKS